MIPIYSRSPDPATVDHDVLASLYSRSENGDGTATLNRRPYQSGRLFSRILFPKFPVAVTDVSGIPRYSLKPDLLASVFFFVFVVVSIVFIVDPDASDGNPTWLPLIFVGLYVIQALLARSKTKAAFDRITSGIPLGSESDIVAQVTALLEEEQREQGQGESPPGS